MVICPLHISTDKKAIVTRVFVHALWQTRYACIRIHWSWRDQKLNSCPVINMTSDEDINTCVIYNKFRLYDRFYWNVCCVVCLSKTCYRKSEIYVTMLRVEKRAACAIISKLTLLSINVLKPHMTDWRPTSVRQDPTAQLRSILVCKMPHSWFSPSIYLYCGPTVTTKFNYKTTSKRYIY